jgi:hypothetical protein
MGFGAGCQGVRGQQILGRQIVQRASDLAYHLGRHVRVNLGCLDALVPEQFLNGAYVGSILKKVRGERVPKGVHRGAFRDTSRTKIVSDDRLDSFL